MGTSSSKKQVLCCPCRWSSNSCSSSSSYSIDENYLPTFDRLSLKNETINKSIRSEQLFVNRKSTTYLKSIENLEKTLHGTASIDQWIDSLPILGTPSLNRTAINPVEIPRETPWNQFPDKEFVARLASIKENRFYLDLIQKCQLNFYVKDFRSRLNNCDVSQTFADHFSSSTIIYPSRNHQHSFINTLQLQLIIPSESILPILSSHPNGSYRLHEQVRSRCYFLPSQWPRIESNQFVSNDGFQTGSIRFDQNMNENDFSSFNSEENCWYLSANSIRQWFQTLILVNQTCAIAKRFLTGDGSHLTCLIKSPSDENFTFAALRLPSSSFVTESSRLNCSDDKSDPIVDAFSSTFLSKRCRPLHPTIQIDYEQYSFALALHRWPQVILDNFYTDSKRFSQRQWPNNDQVEELITHPLLLIPLNDCWEVRFDVIEEKLFQLMSDSQLLIYSLCQQIFSRTSSQRQLIKHCFLNYSERFGFPLSKNRNNLRSFFDEFFRFFNEQIEKKFIANYFNSQMNLFDPNENYQPWLEMIEEDLHYPMSFSSFVLISNRSLKVEFLFHFIDHLYQTFHQQRSQFHLHDQVLRNLHQQLCLNLNNDDDDEDSNRKYLSQVFNQTKLLDQIQKDLSIDFETNAELVHTCLNQIRKAQSSLIFHYTWTIYIQYLHTYYNLLWNLSDDQKI